MENWLVKHAYEHVWCHPYNDGRRLVKPKRITPTEGEIHGMVVTGLNIKLPVKQQWFHVFQLGAVDTVELGLGRLATGWAKASTLVNELGSLLTVYNEEGRTLPLEYVWLRRLTSNAVILAVGEPAGHIHFGREDLFVSFYRGHFRNTTEYTDAHKPEHHGQVVRNTAERFAVVQRYQTWKQKPGMVSAYVNGYYREQLREIDIKIWDYVELIRDGLVEKVVYLNFKDMLTFHSALDGRRKYVVHPPKDQDERIHFYNDVELFVLHGNDGRLFHQHRSESLRHLTHRDYSIPTDRITDYIKDIPAWGNPGNLTLKLVIRRSGLDRPMRYEHLRIHELYKLSDVQIVDAMVGINSTVPEWRAATLEQSAFNRLMAVQYPKLTNQLATQAYGYNAVSHYAADTPQRPEWVGSRLLAKLPPLLAADCTVYEYDSDGLLLGYYNHIGTVDDYYECRHVNCELIEAIVGQGGRVLDITEDAQTFVTEPGINYRFYLNVLKGGVPTDEFIDVTGDTTQYTIDTDGTVLWKVDVTRRQPTIWSDKRFLTYGFEGDLYNGQLRFTIDRWVNDSMWKPLKFQAETLELWMNGKALIQNIDYYVNWPEVVIVNKSYLSNDTNYHKPWIDVRCRGLAESLRVAEHGFVVNGLLSNNNEFDVRDDKVVRITVGGTVYHRGQLQFREDTSVAVNPLANGLPYSVDDPTVPLRRLVSQATYPYRDDARALDERVEAYLTEFLPTPPAITHNPIQQRHYVFSPILNKVIHDMLRGLLIPVQDSETNYISTQQLDALIEPYHDLLFFDPIRNYIDQRYVDVHPHDGYDYIELTELQYAVVERINHRYLGNKVVVNKLIRIKV